MTSLVPTLQAFFTDRLMRQRHASPHTVAAYRDSFRLLFAYVADATGKAPAALDWTDLDATTVGGFLHHLEVWRGNSVRTRNTRLSAIHSFFEFAALHHPEHADLIQRVLAIPEKRYDSAVVAYLTRAEVDALLASPDRTTWTGQRDHALMLLGVQTGLRVSELAALRGEDITMGAGAHVRCYGKGRICGIRHISPYVAPRTMSRRRSKRPPLGGDRACWLDIFRSGQRLSRNASRGSGGR